MRINRENLLSELQTVEAGLSIKVEQPQSNCFVFKDGEVMTFNDEVACRRKCSLNIEGAVIASPFSAIMQRLTKKLVEINVKNDKLYILAGRSKTAIRMEMDVELPIESVEKPGKFKSLPPEFVEAVNLARECASNNESEQKITCVHIHPDYIEASDNVQAIRYNLTTGLDEPVLVKAQHMKSVVESAATKFSVTDSWIHFKNPANGLIISCRRFLDDFPDLAKWLVVEGKKIAMPDGLADIIGNAEIFSSEDQDRNRIQVTMLPGLMKIKGLGHSGYHIGGREFKYKGKPLQFDISPKLLLHINENYNDVVVGERQLKVEKGNYVYITCIGTPKSKEEDDGGDSRQED